jgi:hypothetical protein
MDQPAMQRQKYTLLERRTMKVNVTLRVPDKFCNECRFIKRTRAGNFCGLFRDVSESGWNCKTANWDEPRRDPKDYTLREDGYNLLKCKMCEESLIRKENA